MSAEVPFDVWIPVTKLAEVEHTSRQQVYHLIDAGVMPHSRIGNRIRVRRSDWRRIHEDHLKGGAA